MNFHLQDHMSQLYEQTDHLFEFKAEELEDALEWQGDLQRALTYGLKISGRTLPDAINSEKLSEIDKGGYVEEKHMLMVDGVPAPMYVLIPKGKPPYIPVMAFHGHGIGVHTILGTYPEHSGADNNFAQQLAQDGYLVCAIEQRGFGERVTDQMNQPDGGNSCRHMAFSYLLHDRTLVGERVWDGMTAVSYMLNRDDVIGDELTCVGFSGGGTTAMFLSALDRRIQKVVIKSYFCAYSRSILGVSHCECNYVPDLLTLGDAAEIAGLIAPRPVQIISGETDPIFPVDGVREQYDRLQQIYRVFGAANNCSLDLHPDAHRANYKLMADWIQQH